MGVSKNWSEWEKRFIEKGSKMKKRKQGSKKERSNAYWRRFLFTNKYHGHKLNKTTLSFWVKRINRWDQGQI